MLHDLGAHVIEADAVGRRLMEPGEPVYSEIVKQFGRGVVRGDGTLDRRLLADLAFQQDRRQELSKIVHPAVIAAQEQWMLELFSREPEAVAVVESALIFEAERDGTVPGWRKRFDTVVLVTAPKALKIVRYIARQQPVDAEHRSALAKDAEARLASQIPDEEKLSLADTIIHNDASIDETRSQVQHLWSMLGEKGKLRRAATKGTAHV